ncbi:MAG: peptidylprolyl isomerase [Frankiales bacterium]|jgi:peptidylprolyl isomerase|nr:peptidylprolyl isomerase [Frankiales bacterium]MDX6245738.1 peptidylprolyl isomerase [Frankiales bacterium]
MALDKPEIDFPEGEPPTELRIVDLAEGDGREAKAGDTAIVHYVGVAWSSGEEFDASWNRNETFPFPLGAGRVIQGWDQGVVGMKIGGRRRLEIPPHLGYGARGAGAAIKANETLIFVVDLVDLA